jgi:hypothetical protein
MTQEEAKDLLETTRASKAVNSLTRALTLPFYREMKGLLHSVNTLDLEEYS